MTDSDNKKEGYEEFRHPVKKEDKPAHQLNEEYEKWSKKALKDKAGEMGIEGRSNMDKDELIQALRSREEK